MSGARVMLILVMAAVLSPCLPSTAAAQEGKGYTVISAVELKRMQDSGTEILIIDTLAASTYKEGHIPGAKHFEFPNGTMDPWDKAKTGGKSADDFVAFLGDKEDKPLVFYCLDDK